MLRPGLVKGPWTAEEDGRLVELVERHGVKRWSFLAKELDSGRLGKQCRERWYNHLDPAINKGAWTREEDDKIIETHRRMGSKWAQIARAVGNGRTDNAIKNRWNSTLKRVVGGEIGRPTYNTDEEEVILIGQAAAASGNNTAAVASRKRLREPSSPPSVRARAFDDIDYDLLSRDRSTCTPEELDRMRRERNRMHARKSRERKRARAEAASGADAAPYRSNYPEAEHVRKVSTATPPPTLEGQVDSAPSTPSTLATTVRSIRSDLSDDDAIAAEALSTLTTSSPLPRPNLIVAYSSDDSAVITPSSQLREEVSATDMADVPGLTVPTLPKANANNSEVDAVGLLLHFNNQTKSLQFHAATNN